MAFGGEQVLARLAGLPRPARYWVGFSGGADSTALLQALHECRERLDAELRAVHFHHGLDPAADDWLGQCRTFCSERGIPLHEERLELDPAGRAGLEEAARDARYRVVADLLQAGDMYLTAHHAEDQAETLFLNLMRGSGLEGLAGIPQLRTLGRGWVGRPLLDVERTDLEAWLRSRGIRWIEDPANRDVSFDRNYLRHELFPLLDRRWPGLPRRLARTARHAREAAGAMAAFIERQQGHLLRDPVRMPVGALLDLDLPMQALVLRQWLRRNEIPSLPESRLRELLQQLAGARSGNRAEACWADWTIKRYRDELWLHRSLPDLACRTARWHNAGHVNLGPVSGTLTLGDADIVPPPGWQVGPRRSGARFRFDAQAPGRTLKQCFQACGVPPWLRPGVPVLYWDDEPVAVGDWQIAERLRRWLQGHGAELTWLPAAPVLDRVRADCRHRE
jgi:tRNA(Ile)-lysidine synthase